MKKKNTWIYPQNKLEEGGFGSWDYIYAGEHIWFFLVRNKINDTYINKKKV